MKIMPVRPMLTTPVRRLQTPPAAPRFGALCPICLTLMACGIGAGVAALRQLTMKPDNRYSLQKLYGKELGDQLLSRLEQIEAQKPGVIESFMTDPEKGSVALMAELGEELSQKLQAQLEKQRKKP